MYCSYVSKQHHIVFFKFGELVINSYFMLNMIFYIYFLNVFTLITSRCVFPRSRDFDMFSTNNISLMLSSRQMFFHIVLVKDSTAWTDYSSVSFMRHDVQ